MVKFSSRAHIVSEMKNISDDASRQTLMDAIPKDLFSSTCIGCGLDLARQMLSEGGPGGIILLVTDGQNSPGYHDICDVQGEIMVAGIRVISIAFGAEADKNIETLADLTDGKSYFVRDEDTSEALNEAFQSAITYQSAVSADKVHVKLYETMIRADRQGVVDGQFKVDPTVGRQLKMTLFNLDKTALVGSMELTGPNGQKADTIAVDGTTASVTVDLAQVKFQIGI